jgi:D-threonate/D-erythronate kinase
MPVCELSGPGEEVLPGAYVIADDFTGACDTGVLFRSAGVSVSVELDAAEFAHSPRPERLGNILGPVKVIVTDTRTMEPDVAAAVAESMGRSIRELGASHAYQKIDSTMRGNVGAEIEALLAGLGRTTAVLCPAFPAMGRTIRQGILFVDGKPVTQTQYARDPRNPIDADALADIVHATAPELDVVAVTRDALAAAIDSASGGHLVLVVDAETDADLDEIAGLLAQRRDVLPVGAAEPLALGRIILASGSANPRSIEQLQVLEDIGLEIVRLDKRELTTDEGAEREGKRALEQLLRQAADAPLVAVALTDQRVEVPPGPGPLRAVRRGGGGRLCGRRGRRPACDGRHRGGRRHVPIGVPRPRHGATCSRARDPDRNSLERIRPWLPLRLESRRVRQHQRPCRRHRVLPVSAPPRK